MSTNVELGGGRLLLATHETRAVIRQAEVEEEKGGEKICHILPRLSGDDDTKAR